MTWSLWTVASTLIGAGLVYVGFTILRLMPASRTFRTIALIGSLALALSMVGLQSRHTSLGSDEFSFLQAFAIVLFVGGLAIVLTVTTWIGLRTNIRQHERVPSNPSLGRRSGLFIGIGLFLALIGYVAGPIWLVGLGILVVIGVPIFVLTVGEFVSTSLWALSLGLRYLDSIPELKLSASRDPILRRLIGLQQMSDHSRISKCSNDRSDV